MKPYKLIIYTALVCLMAGCTITGRISRRQTAVEIKHSTKQQREYIEEVSNGSSDDDYRLSCMQGNFVTLTNTTNEDIDRIIDYHLGPLHVSVHATEPDIRTSIIGKKV